MLSLFEIDLIKVQNKNYLWTLGDWQIVSEESTDPSFKVQKNNCLCTLGDWQIVSEESTDPSIKVQRIIVCVL